MVHLFLCQFHSAKALTSKALYGPAFRIYSLKCKQNMHAHTCTHTMHHACNTMNW
jgi:hypothetical protein